MVFKINKRAAAIGGGILVSALLLSNVAKASSTPAKPECPPFKKINRQQLEAEVKKAVDAGMKGLERISSHVGQVMFPTDPQLKQPIPWPTASPYAFPAGTPAYVLCLYNELKKIISELDVPEEPAEPPSPAKIFNQLITSDPTPGKFFKIKQGWTYAGTGANRVGYQALNKVSNALAKSGKARLDYLRCLTLSHWNRSLYGAPKRSTQWNEAYGFNTVDGKYWLWPAFMPWHEDAISKIVNGELPERSITAGGDRVSGGTYGLLWLPPIDPDVAVKNDVVSCNLDWPDGTTALEPPAELLSLLT